MRAQEVGGRWAGEGRFSGGRGGGCGGRGGAEGGGGGGRGSRGSRGSRGTHHGSPSGNAGARPTPVLNHVPHEPASNPSPSHHLPVSSLQPPFPSGIINGKEARKNKKEKGKKTYGFPSFPNTTPFGSAFGGGSGGDGTSLIADWPVVSRVVGDWVIVVHEEYRGGGGGGGGGGVGGGLIRSRIVAGPAAPALRWVVVVGRNRYI